MNENLISIIMPAYNAEQYIALAIQSVIEQSYSNWQLVIVDDGSTDRTLEIVRGYEKKDINNRIVVIHQENSGTAAAARNTALEYVTGEFAQILDADDYLSKDCLQKYMDVIQNNNTIDIISPISLSVDDLGNEICEIAKVSERVGLEITGQEGFKLSLDWIIHGWFCVRSSILKRIKFDPLLINGDEFTTRKLLYNARNIYFTDGVYYYRDNQQSTTKSSRNNVRMFETLWTDRNIYNYAVCNNMLPELQKKCYNKRVHSLVAYQAKYNRENHMYTDEQKENVEGTLKTNYEEIFKLKKIIKGYSIYEFFLFASRGKYERFCKIVEIYNRARTLMKREKT